MTPKEKANDLLDKYWTNGTHKETARLYCFIMVDEILKIPNLSGAWQEGTNMPLNNSQRPYWIKVLEEISNL